MPAQLAAHSFYFNTHVYVFFCLNQSFAFVHFIPLLYGCWGYPVTCKGLLSAWRFLHVMLALMPVTPQAHLAHTAQILPYRRLHSTKTKTKVKLRVAILNCLLSIQTLSQQTLRQRKFIVFLKHTAALEFYQAIDPQKVLGPNLLYHQVKTKAKAESEKTKRAGKKRTNSQIKQKRKKQTSKQTNKCL